MAAIWIILKLGSAEWDLLLQRFFMFEERISVFFKFISTDMRKEQQVFDMFCSCHSIIILRYVFNINFKSFIFIFKFIAWFYDFVDTACLHVLHLLFRSGSTEQQGENSRSVPWILPFFFSLSFLFLLFSLLLLAAAMILAITFMSFGVFFFFFQFCGWKNYWLRLLVIRTSKINIHLFPSFTCLGRFNFDYLNSS